MTSKVCPFMSGKTMSWNDKTHIYTPRFIECLREGCIAWVPETYGCSSIGDVGCNDIDGDTCCTTCTSFVKRINREGYCKLIGMVGE